MDSELKMLLGFVASALVGIVTLVSTSSGLDLHSYRLMLTQDGCTYAQSIGFSPEKSLETCSIQARYRPFKLGDGGTLYLDNDETLNVSSSMVLASSKLAVDLPMTSGQKTRMKWFFIWMAVALSIFSWSILQRIFDKKKKGYKK